MSDPDNVEFNASVPVLLCRDLQSSIDFYVEQLGFELRETNDVVAQAIVGHAAAHFDATAPAVPPDLLGAGWRCVIAELSKQVD